MNNFPLISNLALWVSVLILGVLLLGALRGLALLRWQVAQLEATTPSQLGRGGLRPGRKAPEFTLPALSGAGEVALQHYTKRKLLLVFMQPGCATCHQIVPELNRLHRTGELPVLVVHNGDMEAVKEWTKRYRPHFPVARQERFELSKRYEAFVTPFAFLIDERGVISARGIVSTREFLGFVLAGAKHDEKDGNGQAETFPEFQASPVDAGEAARS